MITPSLPQRRHGCSILNSAHNTSRNNHNCSQDVSATHACSFQPMLEHAIVRHTRPSTSIPNGRWLTGDVDVVVTKPSLDSNLSTECASSQTSQSHGFACCSDRRGACACPPDSKEAGSGARGDGKGGLACDMQGPALELNRFRVRGHPLFQRQIIPCAYACRLFRKHRE